LRSAAALAKAPVSAAAWRRSMIAILLIVLFIVAMGALNFIEFGRLD
jgi:hypothetical protein